MSAIVGSFAAYFGGWFERISLWVIDLLLVLPVVHHHRRAAAQRQPGQQHLAADRAADPARLDAHGPRRAQPHDVAARPRVRHGGEVHGRPRTDDRGPPHHPQHLVAADRRRHRRRGGRRAGRDHAVVLRLRHPAARDLARHADRPGRAAGDDLPVDLLRRRRSRSCCSCCRSTSWATACATPSTRPRPARRSGEARRDARERRRAAEGPAHDVGEHRPQRPGPDVDLPVRGRRRARPSAASSFDLAAGEVLGDRRRVRLGQVGHVAGGHGPAPRDGDAHRVDQAARRRAARQGRRRACRSSAATSWRWCSRTRCRR